MTNEELMEKERTLDQVIEKARKKRVMKNMILFGMMCFGAGGFFAFVILDPETLKLVGTTILKKMMFIK